MTGSVDASSPASEAPPPLGLLARWGLLAVGIVVVAAGLAVVVQWLGAEGPWRVALESAGVCWVSAALAQVVTRRLTAEQARTWALAMVVARTLAMTMVPVLLAWLVTLGQSEWTRWDLVQWLGLYAVVWIGETLLAASVVWGPRPASPQG